MRATAVRPDGLVYEPDLLDASEEARRLDVLRRLELRPVEMRGQASRRTVRMFGFDYDFSSFGLTPTDPLPASLAVLRGRVAELAGAQSDELAQVLVTRYPAGAAIGWHRDAPPFGVVAGVSLAAPCRMRFQRGAGDERRVFELELAPRSAYVLAGQARSAWQHSIPPVREERWSVTFRTLRNPERWRA